MTPSDLMRSLKRRIEAVVQDYRLYDEAGVPRVPVIFAGYPPNKQTIDEVDAPNIIIRAIDGNIAREGNFELETVTVLIAAMVYQESARDPGEPDTGPVTKHSGWDAVMQMLTRIRQSLLKNRMLDSRYELALPLKWDIPQEQPEPQWYGFITAKFQMIVPENEDYEEFLNGTKSPQSYDSRLGENGVADILRTKP